MGVEEEAEGGVGEEEGEEVGVEGAEFLAGDGGGPGSAGRAAGWGASGAGLRPSTAVAGRPNSSRRAGARRWCGARGVEGVEVAENGGQGPEIVGALRPGEVPAPGGASWCLRPRW